MNVHYWRWMGMAEQKCEQKWLHTNQCRDDNIIARLATAAPPTKKDKCDQAGEWNDCIPDLASSNLAIPRAIAATCFSRLSSLSVIRESLLLWWTRVAWGCILLLVAAGLPSVVWIAPTLESCFFLIFLSEWLKSPLPSLILWNILAIQKRRSQIQGSRNVKSFGGETLTWRGGG